MITLQKTLHTLHTIHKLNRQTRLVLLSVTSLFFLIACSENSKNVATETSANTEFSSAKAHKKNAGDLEHYLTRDIQDDVFYFVLPDRFHNGNTDNDNGSKTISISQGGFNPSHNASYHGGDIQGLTEKIPYIKNLGASAIWLTPILRNQAMQGENSGYHGYWVLDFTEIDPHLGSNEDLKNFIDAAHAENIKVYFDIITNHTADVIKYPECHGADGAKWSEGGELCPYKTLAQKAAGDRYTTLIPAGMESIKTPQWLNDPKFYHNQGDSTFEGENSVYGDFFGLDDINTDDPAVVAGMIDIFKNIINEFKPDGFRIDTVKHVNIEFWQQFAPALLSHAKAQGLPKFFMFGEVYDGNPDVLSKFTTIGNMQSVLDFGFQSRVANVLVHQQSNKALTELFSHDEKYSDPDSNANQLLNFVGNHDMGRFAYLLKQSDFDYAEQEIIERVKLAHAMMYFLRGIPVIYYGDEQGFVGDGVNHDSRQDMMPSLVASYNDDNVLATEATTADDNFNESHPLFIEFSKYADTYFSNKALRFGTQEIVYSDEASGIFAVTRNLANEQQLLVVFNTSTTHEKTTFNVTGAEIMPIMNTGKSSASFTQTNFIDVNQAPLSVAIYQVN